MNKIVLEFTDQEMGVINAALMELPYRLSAPILQSINLQLVKKSKPSEEIVSDDSSDPIQ